MVCKCRTLLMTVVAATLLTAATQADDRSAGVVRISDRSSTVHRATRTVYRAQSPDVVIQTSANDGILLVDGSSCISKTAPCCPKAACGNGCAAKGCCPSACGKKGCCNNGCGNCGNGCGKGCGSCDGSCGCGDPACSCGNNGWGRKGWGWGRKGCGCGDGNNCGCDACGGKRGHCWPIVTYDIIYAANPNYYDRRDARAWAAQGYGVPMAVPLAPNVRSAYNYSWGIPASRLTPISRPVGAYYGR